MPQYFVLQPNGKLARFSSVVDGFCELNLTQDEAIAWCRQQGMTADEAKEKIRRAVDDEEIYPGKRRCDSPGNRWKESLDTILSVHGTRELAEFLIENRDIWDVDAEGY